MVSATEQPNRRNNRSPEDGGEARSTRDRILDVALDLFVDQGYEGTSLREIAERMGFTKAALYYHFASKEDILLELHLRLHALGENAVKELSQVAAEPAAWSTFLQSLIGDFVGQRKLLVLHERNFAALQSLPHDGRHDHKNDDIADALRRPLADRSISPRDRLRLGGAIGAIFAGIMLAAGAFDDIPVDELAAQLRAIVRDILEPA